MEPRTKLNVGAEDTDTFVKEECVYLNSFMAVVVFVILEVSQLMSQTA